MSGLFMLYYSKGTPCEMFQEQQLVQRAFLCGLNIEDVTEN